MRPEVLGGIGGFSGAFSMSAFKDMEKPTLVSGTDGVGTKLKLAFLMDKHNTVGIDCVAMCVNEMCIRDRPYVDAGYKIFVAEVASTCNEALLNLSLIHIWTSGPTLIPAATAPWRRRERGMS